MKKFLAVALAVLALALPAAACEEHAQAAEKPKADCCAKPAEAQGECAKPAAGAQADCCKDKQKAYGHFGVTFTSPVALQEEELGVDAWTFTSEDPKLFVTLARVAPEMKEALSRPEILQTMKATFMATATPGEKFTRGALQGERQTTTVPTEAVLETYLFDLPNGDLVAVGLSYSTQVPAEQGEAFLKQVGETLAASK